MTESATRAGPSPLQDLVVDTAGTLGVVPEREWDALASRRTFYLSHAWLRALEDEPGIEPSYTLVRAGRRLLGAAPSYLWDGRATAMMTYYDPFEVVAAERVPLAERTRWMPTVLAGARSGYANELLVAEGLSPEQRSQVVDALVATALAPVDDGRAATASYAYLSSDAALELEPRLRARRMLVLLYLAEATLELTGPTFDDHVASLEHKLRHQVTRDMKRVADAGARLNRSRLSECVDEAAVLLWEHQQRYGVGDTLDGCRGYLERQAAGLDDRAVVFEARVGGTLVGFSLAYPWNGTLYLRVVGTAPHVARSGLYFALVFHLPAAYALERGLARLHLGSGSFEAKVRRGARLAPLWGAIAPPGGEEERWRGLLTRWTERAPVWWRHALDAVAGSPAAALADSDTRP